MMRRIVCLFLSLLLVMCVSLALSENLGSMKVVNCEEWVSLREKPDARAERIVKVPLGAIVENCRVQTNKFIYAEYNGKKGYIDSQYLVEAETKSMFLGDLRVANCSDWVNMRAEPSTDAKRVAKVPLNAIFEDCTAAENGFISGTYKGQAGYISSDYLVSAQKYEADRLLADCRIRLAAGGDICGAVLLSQSMAGNWTLTRARQHLDAALENLPEEWKQLIAAIPADRIVEIAGGRELYLIIPTDEAASVSINELTPGMDAERGRFKRVAYNSRRGEPFLLRCNASEQPWDDDAYQPEWQHVQPVFDCEVNIVAGSGAGLTWYPRLNDQNGGINTQAAAGSVFDLTDDLVE